MRSHAFKYSGYFDHAEGCGEEASICLRTRSVSYLAIYFPLQHINPARDKVLHVCYIFHLNDAVRFSNLPWLLLRTGWLRPRTGKLLSKKKAKTAEFDVRWFLKHSRNFAYGSPGVLFRTSGVFIRFSGTPFPVGCSTVVQMFCTDWCHIFKRSIITTTNLCIKEKAPHFIWQSNVEHQHQHNKHYQKKTCMGLNYTTESIMGCRIKT